MITVSKILQRKIKYIYSEDITLIDFVFCFTCQSQLSGYNDINISLHEHREKKMYFYIHAQHVNCLIFGK